MPSNDLDTNADMLGTEHGTASATWFFSGHEAAYIFEATLQGIEDGDPQIVDQFPVPDLGGEFADSYTSRDLAEDLGLEDDADAASEAADAYDVAYRQAVEDEIARYCRIQLGA